MIYSARRPHHDASSMSRLEMDDINIWNHTTIGQFAVRRVVGVGVGAGAGGLESIVDSANLVPI